MEIIGVKADQFSEIIVFRTAGASSVSECDQFSLYQNFYDNLVDLQCGIPMFWHGAFPRIRIDETTDIWIPLQHFLEDVIGCHPGRSNGFNEKFLAICSAYCREVDLLAEFLEEESTLFFNNFHAAIHPEYGIISWIDNTGGCLEMREFGRKHVGVHPASKNYDKYEFCLSMNFGQIEKDYELVLITASLWGNGGSVDLYRGLHEVVSENMLISIIEDILRGLFPGGNPRPNPLPKASHDLAISLRPSQKPHNETESPAWKDAYGFLPIMEHTNVKETERWKKIMECPYKR